MVRMGELAVSKDPGHVLASIGLGSCIGLVLLEAARPIAGLAHIMLPASGNDQGSPVGKFNGRFLVRGGRHEVVEGHQRARTVVIEFPSYDAALACYRSADYQAAVALRKGKAECDLVVIEGVGETGH